MDEDRPWTDRIVGARMQVDREFGDRIAASRFTRQEWSLIMTAVEFEIRDPEDPGTAELAVRTDGLEHVLPELETIREQFAGGGPGASAGGASGGSGLLDGVKRALGMDARDEDRAAEREAAERLTAEYARALQAHLEEGGRWGEICEQAASERTE